MQRTVYDSRLACWWRMPLAIWLTIFSTVIVCRASAQNTGKTVTLSGRQITFEQAMEAIKKQTSYLVMCPASIFKQARAVNLSVKDMPVTQFLQKVIGDQPYEFNIEANTIFIREKAAPNKQPATEKKTLTEGTVMDKDGQPLPGATVRVKGTNSSAVTDELGHFDVNAQAGQALVISFVGYNSQEVIVSAGTKLVVRLQVAATEITEVVVSNGIFTRRRDAFTGSVSTFTGEQIKSIGNKNVFESLKTLDPSFILVENNLQGSNPNRLPNIEIRGKTSINLSATNVNSQFSGDPNQPLFILDGFESTLQTIYDLDINRIASITLLKDAASTALYGSKAANGVVIVETKRPVAGELRVNYTADLSFDMPDLTSYNLMNAEEKLEFERLAGLYYTPLGNQWASDSLYNARLMKVRSGVNTYWLSEPVRTGFTHRHSVRVAGGSNELLFGAGLFFRDQNGVMKGSDRGTWGGNFDMTFRRSKINISNNLTISSLNGTESPYGSFDAFAQAVPYYPKYNADGSIPMYLSPGDVNLPNPLYNASLYSINNNKNFSFRDNLQGIYNISPSFRLTGGVSISRDNGSTVIFIPPDNTVFANVDMYQKGSYTKTTATNGAYNANLMLSYAKVIGRSQVNANVRGDIQHMETAVTTFSAVGFPFGTNGNPRFAYGYTPNSRPASSDIVSRNAGMLVSVNYTYDQRFLLDATYRLDGSSNFGSNKRTQPFASAGVGWNISKEPFLRNARWINLLKLRANTGYTGNQNLGSFTSTSVFTFLAGINPFGQGLDMTSLGNPNLEWQRTLQQSFGIDFTFFNNRITGSVEYYDKKTDPLIVSAGGIAPASVGIGSSYVYNVGSLKTTGYAFNLRLSPVYNMKERIVWTVGITGQTVKSIFGGLGASSAKLNALSGSTLIRYQDGNSPDDIWAVVSHGIDPATGNEIFQNIKGQYTFVYNTADIVKVGNTRPVIEGVINTTFTYKSFSFGANMRYSIKGYRFNDALYYKVENFSGTGVYLNQDKRALYERWKKPGDISEFKSIALLQSTPMSSRFVQKDTHFIGESFNLTWRVSNGWIRKLHMQTLAVSAYMNDIFRVETIRSERGIDYPFSRSASLSVNVSF